MVRPRMQWYALASDKEKQEGKTKVISLPLIVRKSRIYSYDEVINKLLSHFSMNEMIKLLFAK